MKSFFAGLGLAVAAAFATTCEAEAQNINKEWVAVPIRHCDLDKDYARDSVATDSIYLPTQFTADKYNFWSYTYFNKAERGFCPGLVGFLSSKDSAALAQVPENERYTLQWVTHDDYGIKQSGHLVRYQGRVKKHAAGDDSAAAGALPVINKIVDVSVYQSGKAKIFGTEASYISRIFENQTGTYYPEIKRWRAYDKK